MTSDKVFLLIGPKGIGKSSVISKLIEKDFLKYKLDDVLIHIHKEPNISVYFKRIGKEQFFHESIAAIELIKQENPDKTILIELGAETIDWEDSTDKLLNYQLISLTCEKERLYNRVKTRSSEKRSFEKYVASEFKPHKEKLYENSKFKIDTTYLESGAIATKVFKIVVPPVIKQTKPLNIDPFKLAAYITAPIVYTLVLFVVGFGVGMSHSVPWHKFKNEIYRYYFLIIMLELLIYLFISYLIKGTKGEGKEVIGLLMVLYLSAMFPWRIIQFTQYGHGYDFFKSTGLNEQVMVFFVNFLPLIMIILATIFREKVGNLLFGYFIKHSIPDQEK